MSPAIADNLLAAICVALPMAGASDNHARPKTGLCRTPWSYGKTPKKGCTIPTPADTTYHFDSLAGWSRTLNPLILGILVV